MLLVRFLFYKPNTYKFLVFCLKCFTFIYSKHSYIKYEEKKFQMVRRGGTA